MRTNLEYLRENEHWFIEQLCDLNSDSDCVNCKENRNCYECNVKNLKWLLEERKGQILDDVEKEYISSVIKPFRSKIEYISINCFSNSENQYLVIGFRNYTTRMVFPYFKANTMYKGMEVRKRYTLEELGL